MKSPGPNDDFEQKLAAAAPGEIVSEIKSDPWFNRLSSLVHTAVQQLVAVNSNHSLANILIMVNHDKASYAGDLFETLTGHVPAESGSLYPTTLNVSDGRIREEKLRVDLYVWRDADTGSSHFLVTEGGTHESWVRSLFNITKSVGLNCCP